MVWWKKVYPHAFRAGTLRYPADIPEQYISSCSSRKAAGCRHGRNVAAAFTSPQRLKCKGVRSLERGSYGTGPTYPCLPHLNSPQFDSGIWRWRNGWCMSEDGPVSSSTVVLRIIRAPSCLTGQIVSLKQKVTLCRNKWWRLRGKMEHWVSILRHSAQLGHHSCQRQFHPGPARKLSTNLYDICHCWVFSE